MIGWLAHTLASSALLLVLVMAVRPVIRAWAGPAAAYWLWALPVARLILPPLPAPALPMGGLSLEVQGAGLPAMIHPGQAAWPWATTLLVLWGLGAVLHLSWRCAEYRRFVRRARAAAVGVPFRIGRVRIWTSAFVDGPVAAGLWRKDIFLPLDFTDRFDPGQRGLALAHELTHHRRGDILWNLVALVALSAHWFNPLAHLAHRLYRQDQELACDAAVLAAGNESSRFQYGLTLARAAMSAKAAPLCALGQAALLKRRLIALAAPDRRLGPGSGAALAIAAAGAVLATGSFSASLPAAPDPHAQSMVSAPSWSPDIETASQPLPDRKPVETTRRRATSWIREAAERAVEDPLEAAPSLADRRSADYLAERRRLGLLRHRPPAASPADLASARGRPLLTPPPADF